MQEELDKQELLTACLKGLKPMLNLPYNWLKCSKIVAIQLAKICRISHVLINFTEGKEYPPKWVSPSQKGSFLFNFRKDASKFLNQILKQQQKGNSKAGLGMSENLALNKKYRKSKLSWS